jgi:hypothetical protein
MSSRAGLEIGFVQGKLLAGSPIAFGFGHTFLRMTEDRLGRTKATNHQPSGTD